MKKHLQKILVIALILFLSGCEKGYLGLTGVLILGGVKTLNLTQVLFPTPITGKITMEIRR